MFGKNLLTCLLLLLVGWCTASILQSRLVASEQYGAGTICDHCDDWCYDFVKSFDECYHETMNDTCEGTRCIINNVRAATCAPEESAPPGECPIKWDTWRQYWLQTVRKNMTCTTDDPSSGMKPVISWGECEYSFLNYSGRCFTDDCWGDLDDETPYYGDWTCDN